MPAGQAMPLEMVLGDLWREEEARAANAAALPAPEAEGAARRVIEIEERKARHRQGDAGRQGKE